MISTSRAILSIRICFAFSTGRAFVENSPCTINSFPSTFRFNCCPLLDGKYCPVTSISVGSPATHSPFPIVRIGLLLSLYVNTVLPSVSCPSFWNFNLIPDQFCFLRFSTFPIQPFCRSVIPGTRISDREFVFCEVR